MPLAPHFAAERRRLVQPGASHYFRPSVPGQNVEADGYHSFFDRVELGVQIEKFVLAIMMKFYAGQPGFAQHDTETMMRLMAYRVDPELIVPVGGTGRSDSPIRIIVPAFLMQTVERSGPNGENRWCIAKRQDNYQQPFPTPALLRDDSGQYTIGGTQFCMGNLSASTPKRPCVAKEGTLASFRCSPRVLAALHIPLETDSLNTPLPPQYQPLSYLFSHSTSNPSSMRNGV
ncbi:hypothetical protein JCM11641_006470 [Rhodosporidiobolus odoratus]